MPRPLARLSPAVLAAVFSVAAGAASAQFASPVPSSPAGRFLPTTVPMPLPRDAAPAATGTASTGAPQQIAPAVTATPAAPSAPAASAPPAPPAQQTQVARVDPAGPGALNADQRKTVERVNAYFNSISNMVGNFVQVGPDRSRTEGDFYLQKPGKVRFDYDPPSPVELISDGSSVVVRDRKLATQDLYPLSQTPLRFLLSDKLDLLKDTNIIGVYQDDLFINVVIEEKHPLAGTHRLMLMFGAKDMELKQWTITDPQGYDTTIAIFNLDIKQKPDPSLFKIDYHVPRN